MFKRSMCATALALLFGWGGGCSKAGVSTSHVALPPGPACPSQPSSRACPPCASVSTSSNSGTVGDSPAATTVVDVYNALVEGNYDTVWQRLDKKLASELSPQRIAKIIQTVEQHHGAAKLVDAWSTTIRDDHGEWKAGAGLLRMAKSQTRFRLLLVFNHDSSIRGLWLKPI